MPLNQKGRKIMKSMKKTYGKDAKAVFYASKNKGVIKGVDRSKKKKVKKVISALKKASKAHAGQVKTLQSVMKNGKKKNKRS